MNSWTTLLKDGEEVFKGKTNVAKELKPDLCDRSLKYFFCDNGCYTGTLRICLLNFTKVSSETVLWFPLFQQPHYCRAKTKPGRPRAQYRKGNGRGGGAPKFMNRPPCLCLWALEVHLGKGWRLPLTHVHALIHGSATPSAFSQRGNIDIYHTEHVS